MRCVAGGRRSIPSISRAGFVRLAKDPKTRIAVRPGNVGVGTIRKTATWTIDFALSKTVKVHERVGPQIRADAFDLLNHVNYGSSAAGTDGPTFGGINGIAGGMRVVQLNARLSWQGNAMSEHRFSRRVFLSGAGLASAVAARPAAGPQAVLVLDPADPVAAAAPVRWAAAELEEALRSHGVAAVQRDSLSQVPADAAVVLIAGAGSATARNILKGAGLASPADPEALAVSPGRVADRTVTLACGSDARGAVYAVLELADRVRHAEDPLAALEAVKPGIEKPANRIRSIARCFESDVEDKPWFYDKAFWHAYLTMLATHRYNRFSLTLGLGYNRPRNLRDVYFYFAYPFLVSPPGYNVRARPLPDAERDRNLEMLRFISEETARRGLRFQLALWTHAYEWEESPEANYVIEGLTPERHAAYCRDALAEILNACPAIGGVTFRIHGESGIPEGSYDFWRTVFDGIVRAKRQIEIDMHAKGMDFRMIDVALATGMPVVVSPKYWAEHMGLPYHQAAIRELEKSREATDKFFSLSNGSRRFLRYGYGDLLREDRRYGILYRIWPGTQRVLLWGDPATAAGYGRSAHFCGSDGVEWCEPLSFKGRMGSGKTGGRCAYADASLNPRYDWQKFNYTYRLWGRLIYNPDTDPDGWRRQLTREFGPAASSAEQSLANASRVLLLVTTAHGASGSNNTYWPEIYTNMPIVDEAKNKIYRDTPQPRRFGAVSPFDPQLFSRVDDFAKQLLAGRRDYRYSPAEVAQWLEGFAQAAVRHWQAAERRAPGHAGAEMRRWAADIAIQSGLGRFFAWKFRAALLWAVFELTGEAAALQEALKAYRVAREAWADIAARAKSVYVADITYGMTAHLRGHWADRLAAIDEDIADMEKRLGRSETGAPAGDSVSRAIREILSPSARPTVRCRHRPPSGFRPGKPLALELVVESNQPSTVRLHYRHANQAEEWQSADAEGPGDRYRILVPAEYTQSPYPLLYYFELRTQSGTLLYPGFDATLSREPYFVVRQA